MASAKRQRSWRVLLAVFVGAAFLSAVPAVRSVLEHDGDPTSLLRVGSQAVSRTYIERDFSDPVLAPDYGHDGQQYYVLAAVFPDLREAEEHVDRLRYRARRVLLPMLVSPLPAGAPTVWGMFAVNVIAIGAAAVAVAELARRLGTSPWLGLSVAFTPALVESVSGSLGDAPAFALALWGCVLWRRRPWLAALLFLLAALSRETALVAPLACLVVARDRRWGPLLTPFVGFGAWLVASSLWLPSGSSSTTNVLGDASTVFTWPFGGWIDVGWGDAVLLGLALAGASLWAAWELRHRLPDLSLWLLLDLVLLAISNEAVVFRAWNFARVAPLAVPALALAVGLRLAERTSAGSDARVEPPEPAPARTLPMAPP